MSVPATIEEMRAAITLLLATKGYPAPVFDKNSGFMSKPGVYPRDVRVLIYQLSTDPDTGEGALYSPGVYLVAVRVLMRCADYKEGEVYR